MFYTYVLAASGNKVDFDRAAYLMDSRLLQDALAALDRTEKGPEDAFDKAIRKKMRSEKPGWSPSRRAQFVWETYCAAHEEKYGELFEPDANPKWDT